MTKAEAIRILSTRDKYGVPCGYTSGYQEALDMAIEALKERPKGKWNVYEVANTEEEQPIAWECSECGEVVEVQYNFCPNCGNRKKGEGDD